MKRKFGKSNQLFYFQVSESLSPINMKQNRLVNDKSQDPFAKIPPANLMSGDSSSSTFHHFIILSYYKIKKSKKKKKGSQNNLEVRHTTHPEILRFSDSQISKIHIFQGSFHIFLDLFQGF